MKQLSKNFNSKLSVSAALTSMLAIGAASTASALTLVDTTTLSLTATSKIDFQANALVVRTAIVGTPTAGIYNGLSRYAQTGLNIAGDPADFWWGFGFASTNARAAAQVNFTLGIGVVDNNHTVDLGGYLYGPAGFLAVNFAGTATVNPLTGTEILARLTYWGDADLNGFIDGTDYSLIDNGFNNSLNGWFNGDYDYNGVIDGTDYSLIDNAFNNQGTPFPSLASSGKDSSGGVVPEPASLGLLVLGALGVLARRTRGKAEASI